MSFPSTLFVLGDSISIGYGSFLERLLAGRFQYDRKGYALLDKLPMDSPLINGGDSNAVLAFLHASAISPQPENTILLLNCGLHDLRLDPFTRKHQVELEAYSRNLEQILDLSVARAYRTAWVRTTPVADDLHNRLNTEFLRYNADVMAYNTQADRLVQKAGIPNIDLYCFTMNLCEHNHPGSLENLLSDHIHFTPAVSQLQAAYITGWLEAFPYA